MEDNFDITPIESIASEFLDLYRSNLVMDDRYASGNLVNTATYNVSYDGTILRITLNLQDYWKDVENGTKPHFPDIDKIKEWIRVKPVLPRAINGKLPTENQLAYLIARKISKVGTEGSKTLNRTKDTFSLQSKVKMELIKQISNLIKNKK